MHLKCCWLISFIFVCNVNVIGQWPSVLKVKAVLVNKLVVCIYLIHLDCIIYVVYFDTLLEFFLFQRLQRCHMTVTQPYKYSYFLWAQLTMSAKAFPSLCACRPSACLSVSLLDYLSKPISSYSFNQIAFKFYSGNDHKIGYLACAIFDDRIIFEILANF